MWPLLSILLKFIDQILQFFCTHRCHGNAICFAAILNFSRTLSENNSLSYKLFEMRFFLCSLDSLPKGESMKKGISKTSPLEAALAKAANIGDGSRREYGEIPQLTKVIIIIEKQRAEP